LTPATVESWICAWLARELAVAESAVDAEAPFAALGLDSLATEQLVGDLSEWLARPVPSSHPWDHPTAARLARALVDEARGPGEGSGPDGAKSSAVDALETLLGSLVDASADGDLGAAEVRRAPVREP
jgi:acyl carrier protein